MGNALEGFASAGVSLWLDDLSRPLIDSAEAGDRR